MYRFGGHGRLQWILVVVCLSLMLTASAAVAPPPLPAKAQTPPEVLSPYETLLKWYNEGQLTWESTSKWGRSMGAASSLLGGVVLGVVMDKYDINGYAAARVFGNMRDKLIAGLFPTAYVRSFERLAAAHEQGEGLLMYDPATGITTDAINIQAAINESWQGVVATRSQWTSWQASGPPGAPDTVYWIRGSLKGEAYYVGPSAAGGLQTLYYSTIDGYPDRGQRIRIVRDDGVVILTNVDVGIGGWPFSVANVDSTHGYYLVSEGNSTTTRWGQFAKARWGAAEYLQVIKAGEYEFVDYQPAGSEQPVVLNQPSSGELTMVTPSQVAQVSPSVAYVTNNVTNIYNPPPAGDPSAWDAEAVGRQVSASESTASGIAALPGAIVTAISSAIVPTKSPATRMEELEQLAATKVPMKWGTEISRSTALWFGGTAGCWNLVLPLGFGQDPVSAELCPGFVGDWSRPISAVLFYLLLLAYVVRLARRFLWGGAS